MKVVLSFALIILLSTCSSNKSVYWCGDHACINKKERKAYFKKTMIVEKKIISKKNKKDLTKSQEIIKKAKESEKKRNIFAMVSGFCTGQNTFFLTNDISTN